jgi:hypothetical protein
MTKHTALIKLQSTRAAKDETERECGHWDYENEAGEDHDCCHAMRDAARKHKDQLKVWRREEAGK